MIEEDYLINLHTCVLFIPVCVTSPINNSTILISYERRPRSIAKNFISIVVDLDYVLIIDVHYNIVPTSFKTAELTENFICREPQHSRQSSFQRRKRNVSHKINYWPFLLLIVYFLKFQVPQIWPFNLNDM